MNLNIIDIKIEKFSVIKKKMNISVIYAIVILNMNQTIYGMKKLKSILMQLMLLIVLINQKM